MPFHKKYIKAPFVGAFFLTIFLLVVLSACNNKQENVEVDVKPVKKNADLNKESVQALQTILNDNKNDSLLVLEGDTLVSFIFFKALKSDRKLDFFEKCKLNPLGDSVWFYLKNARLYGLYPGDYFVQRIERLITSVYDSSKSEYYPALAAQAELLMTDAYLKMGAHINKGRFNPDTVLLEWRPAKLDTNWLSILKFGIENNNIKKAFDSLEPPHEGYHFLKHAFLNYIKEHEQINWDSVPVFSMKDTSQVLKQLLKERLRITGDYNDTLKLNDSLKLAKALKSFQKRMNLEPDGKMGKYTKQALQLSKEQTIRQMEMALERWRWEPKKYPEKYAVVNIPSANIRVFEWWKKKKIDTLVLLSNVVVGKPETQTPTLESKINYIIIYPYWNVPFTIAWKEILPMVQRDTAYLRKKNFEVIGMNGEVVTDIGKLPWKKYNREYLPIRFRQRIGDDNSLGICKFNFNNKHGVYLHDTNSKRYFKTFYRYQSHGCIRLDKYYQLARFLIREDTLKLPYDTLDVWLATPEQKKISLRKPLPIYVRYFTAQTDSTKNLRFFIDVYRKDEELMKKLYK